MSTELDRDFAQVAGTDAGKTVLRWIMNECGFHDPSIVLSKIDNELNVRATLHNESLRGHYLNLRRYIPIDDRIKIEYPEATAPVIEPGVEKKKRKTKTEDEPEWTNKRPQPDGITEEPLHRARHKQK